MKQCNDQPSASATQRVSQSNGTAVDVDLSWIQSQIPNTCHRLRGKGSFNSTKSNWLMVIPVRSRIFRVAITGPYPIIAGFRRSSGNIHNTSQWGKSCFSYHTLRHKHHSCGAVVYPQALPAVTDPSAFTMGFSRESTSMVVPGLGNSSVSKNKRCLFLLHLSRYKFLLEVARP